MARPDTCSPWGLEERGGAQQTWGLLGQRESHKAGADVGMKPDSSDETRYLGGCVQFEGRLLGHAAEMGPDLFFITLIIGVIQVVVVS